MGIGATPLNQEHSTFPCRETMRSAYNWQGIDNLTPARNTHASDKSDNEGSLFPGIAISAPGGTQAGKAGQSRRVFSNEGLLDLLGSRTQWANNLAAR